MPAPQTHLIDVRSPSEFASGFLTSDLAPTINIEYLYIAQLPSIYAARGVTVSKNDSITLYCRSGRRSGIALTTLEKLGYVCVRDLGGWEEARGVLDREVVERQLEGMGGEEGEIRIGGKVGGGGEAGKGDDLKTHTRGKSFNVLVEGLKALES